jgi:nucleotide-binding universal stress UspA family protein
MFKKIVWATDGSEAADQALDVATRMASESGGELLAVHCVEMTLPGKASGRYPVFADEQEMEQKIARQVKAVAAHGVPAQMEITRTDAGHAAHAIASVVREQHGEVIVVGTRGRGPIAGLLLGSVTQRLLHTAPCPVLAIPVHDQARS